MSPASTGVGYTGPEPITAAGVFPGYAEARRAVEALRAAGYGNDQIGVVGPGEVDAVHEKRSGLANDPTHTHWEEGAGIGAAVGGLGGLGLGAAVAAGLISPLGPVVAGGTLVALLASAGGGATVGAAVGALAGAGVPEDDAQWYMDEAAQGRVVVTVRAADGDAARDILDRHGGADRHGDADHDELPGPSPETAIPGNALPATPY
jgi:hypothetical protein